MPRFTTYDTDKIAHLYNAAAYKYAFGGKGAKPTLKAAIEEAGYIYPHCLAWLHRNTVKLIRFQGLDE